MICIIHGYLSTEYRFKKHSEKVGIWSSKSAESLSEKRLNTPSREAARLRVTQRTGQSKLSRHRVHSGTVRSTYASGNDKKFRSVKSVQTSLGVQLRCGVQAVL